MLTPGLILPPRSPALDNLRVLAAGCRACSVKGYVDDALRARGTKAVDLRAAGVTVRFELESESITRLPAPPTGGGIADEELDSTNKLGGAKTATDSSVGDFPVAGSGNGASKKGAAGSGNTKKCLQLSVGCCVYQKGTHLLWHVGEGGESSSTEASQRHPAVFSSRQPSSKQTSALQLVRKESTTKRDTEHGDFTSSPPLRPLSPAREGDETSGTSPGRWRRRSPGNVEDIQRPPSHNNEGTWPSTSLESANIPRLKSYESMNLPVPPSSATIPEDEAPPWAGRVGEDEKLSGHYHWGGGPGPRPCKEALTVIQSLRVPLSDPHYFRVAELSLCLGVVCAKKDSGGFVMQTQVFGGGENIGDGWVGELLVTRCAVVGNPRQPRTRADAMLSRIRVEVRCLQAFFAGPQ